MSAKKKGVREKFREDVFERDGRSCAVCRRNEVKFDAHHITDRTLMPHGGYVKENGITLCSDLFPGDDNFRPGQASCHEKAELFHQSGGAGWAPGMHPDDLYKLIGSSKEKAIKASERRGG